MASLVDPVPSVARYVTCQVSGSCSGCVESTVHFYHYSCLIFQENTEKHEICNMRTDIKNICIINFHYKRKETRILSEKYHSLEYEEIETRYCDV